MLNKYKKDLVVFIIEGEENLINEYVKNNYSLGLDYEWIINEKRDDINILLDKNGNEILTIDYYDNLFY
ncbi:hypothetical protein [Oceanivirga salmonicida]|uniref:hypothetical protein n=1 Tax=Oceanivirga salmonicida TaxID=1769291 RepID=UPI0012E2229C|nr:hypothetical protein [Oceanivirga salmonicida]